MGMAFAFGLGVVVGALLAFRAGGRYALARQASILAGEYMGAARGRIGEATGSVLLFLAVVVGGVLIMIFAN
jgi:hypothetical protein